MLWAQLRDDAVHLSLAAYGRVDRRHVLRTVFSNDSYSILALWRLRCAARRWRVPLVNTLLRRVQTVVFGIEIGNDVTLGRGVYFIHPIGTVVGGDARVGDRVRLMGGSTVGTAKDNGYPVIDDEAVVGVGARVLGPIHVGARAKVGANAVLLESLPAGAVAAGVPARRIERRTARSVGDD